MSNIIRNRESDIARYPHLLVDYIGSSVPHMALESHIGAFLERSSRHVFC